MKSEFLHEGILVLVNLAASEGLALASGQPGGNLSGEAPQRAVLDHPVGELHARKLALSIFLRGDAKKCELAHTPG